MKIYSTILIPFFFLVFPGLFAQSLFENALHDDDPQKNDLLHLNGFVRNLVYGGRYEDNNSVHLKSMYSQFGFIVDTDAGKYGGAYAELRYRTGIEYEEKISELELREAYVDLYLGPLDIRAGKQVFSWGASSFLNPSDYFSPQDPTFRSPVNDDLRLPNWAITTNLAVNAGSRLQVIWIPNYLPSVLLTEPFNFPEYIVFTADSLPGMKIKEGNFGIRYDLRTRYLDMELSYYHGYRNNPSIQMDSASFNFVSLKPDLIQLIKTPYRINSAGINLTVPFGSYLFRTEAGWMKPMKNNAVSLPSSEISYTAEIEQSGQNITIIGGYYGKYIIDFEEEEIAAVGINEEFPDLTTLMPPDTPFDPSMINSYIVGQIEGFNRQYNYQKEKFYHAAYASLNVTMFHDLIDLKFPGMFNFTSGELTLMPSLKFNITDGLSFQLGAYYLYGKENSIYDVISPVLNAGYGMIQLKF